MLVNKRVLSRFSQQEQLQALQEALQAVKEGRQYTLYGVTGVAVSTYEKLEDAKQDIRNWSVYPRTTTETIAYNRILKSLGIK